MKNNPSIDHMVSARAARLHPTKFLLPALLCFSVAAARGAGVEKADYVFKNGAVYTMDVKAPKAEAVAVTGKKISYVGDNKGAEACVGKSTQVIDLKGRMLLPGFVEAHIHPTLAFFAGGADLQSDFLGRGSGKAGPANPRCRHGCHR
jgi:hypothetical protein